MAAGDGGASKGSDLAQLSEELRLERVTAAESDPALAKALLARYPPLAGVLGSATSTAQEIWLKRFWGKNELSKAAARVNLERIEAQLVGSNPTQLERLLAGRVALCYLEANYRDARAGESTEGQSFAQAELNLKRQDRAHRRYLSALKTFAEVRRLLVPVVQVNIGEKQVNVAGAAESPTRLPALPSDA